MQQRVTEVTGALPDVDWSVCIRADGRAEASVADERVLPTASMGKVLLLLEVARRMEEGSLDAQDRLRAEPIDAVGDSGLWQHLTERELSVESLAVLVAAVSDNLAANVLLRHVGLSRVQSVSEACGIPRTRLLDRIRDVRSVGDPPWPSEGCAADLALLMGKIAHGEALTPGVSAAVACWLARDADTSMAAGALGLDPLAHGGGPVRLFHKTGTDAGVRADAGHVHGPGGACSYAVLARWDPDATDRTDAVLAAMRDIGQLVRDAVS